MGTIINQIKKQAYGYLQEKKRTARLAFTDVSEAEILAEEATDNYPWGPDAKTMTILAQASFDIDDYWRIVDVLHRRLYCIDWKQWRQSYKALVLLEFLLTHGAEDFAIEFQCDTAVIQELATFCYIDGNGFNWGAIMQRRVENMLKLFGGGQILKEARLKAIKITNEIQGFGSSMASPSASNHSPSSSEASHSSFGSYTTTNSTWNDVIIELNKQEQPSPSKVAAAIAKYSLGGIQEEKPNDYNLEGFHLWDSSTAEESGSLFDADQDDENEEYSNGFFKGIFSKLASISPNKLNDNGGKKALRIFSDNSRNANKKYDRQYSSGF